ncbi:MAG TPA: phosphate-starvation-inducible PsiE family protein [Actinomycetota bacterium]|nr:phosphate-starvation-inducible PsiE family protein [Actinomycetota bacterium]
MSRRGDHGLRDRTEALFGRVEDVLYVAIAAALAIVGFGLFGYVVYDFVSKLGDGDVTARILSLLDGLLLVFIVTELIHTVRAVIDERVLVAEPFLIVGIVAAIRRLVVVSAEAKDLLGTPEFGDAMTEIGVLTGTVVILAVAIFLLRNTTRSEPTSEHEPG